MNVDHIPFINSVTDCTIVQKLYSDSAVLRVSLETLGKTASHLPHSPKKWLDPSVDGLHRWPAITPAYTAHISRFAGYNQIGDVGFHSKPDRAVVHRFVREVLDHCKKHHTFEWLTVPQLPIVDSAARNKVNKLLAEGTKLWKLERGYTGKLIVPAIFTNQRQINAKTERNKKLSAVLSSLTVASADGVWIVDSTLNDQDGSKTFEQTRFPALIQLLDELKDQLSNEMITVAGPYWGMNIVLWARGLVKYPAIGLGNSYQYHIPGSVIMGGKSRLALSPIRRWAIATNKLKTWLEKASSQLSPTDPRALDFATMAKDFGKLQVQSEGRWQIAKFYKDWFDKFSTLPPSGRALALFQDLSSAYVLGKNLPKLPEEEKTARSAARVAKQLMLNCL
jgi:hypothetical protein